MTQENQQFITLDEVIGIQLQCLEPKCRTRVTLEPKQWDNLPNKCPACGAEWWKKTDAKNNDSVGTTVSDLQRTIHRLADFQEKRDNYGEYYRLGCNLKLEITRPEE